MEAGQSPIEGVPGIIAKFFAAANFFCLLCRIVRRDFQDGYGSDDFNGIDIIDAMWIYFLTVWTLWGSISVRTA